MPRSCGPAVVNDAASVSYCTPAPLNVTVYSPGTGRPVIVKLPAAPPAPPVVSVEVSPVNDSPVDRHGDAAERRTVRGRGEPGHGAAATDQRGADSSALPPAVRLSALVSLV